MNKYEKMCKKEGQHIWDTSYQCDDEVGGDFNSIEMELRCLRCGASAFLDGYWNDAPKQWEPDYSDSLSVLKGRID